MISKLSGVGFWCLFGAIFFGTVLGVTSLCLPSLLLQLENYDDDSDNDYVDTDADYIMTFSSWCITYGIFNLFANLMLFVYILVFEMFFISDVRIVAVIIFLILMWNSVWIIIGFRMYFYSKNSIDVFGLTLGFQMLPISFEGLTLICFFFLIKN